jgi:hypothetical protein
MIVISHRRNTIADLKATPAHLGIEIDVRTDGKKLIVQHDPFSDGVSFDHWIESFDHKTLILNVKEEGLEPMLIEKMKSRGLEDYFFLDQSFPFLIKFSSACSGRSAVRVSEFESMGTALSLTGKATWAWIDCFTRFPLDSDQARLLQAANLKLCLVSPELQGRTSEPEINAFISNLKDLNINPDAVCTKRSDIWERHTFAV